jgi:hypothetical protein
MSFYIINKNVPAIKPEPKLTNTMVISIGFASAIAGAILLAISILPG